MRDATYMVSKIAVETEGTMVVPRGWGSSMGIKFQSRHRSAVPTMKNAVLCSSEFRGEVC